MHPLAHMLTGALLGQIAASPAVAVAGGLVSHAVLDAIPHTDGRTFKTRARRTESMFNPYEIEAALKLAAGALIVGWLVSRCPTANAGPIVLGTLAATLPDLVDQPLNRLYHINVLHIRQLHWTVARPILGNPDSTRAGWGRGISVVETGRLRLVPAAQ